MANSIQDLNGFMEIYDSKSTDCRTPFKINLKCSECGNKAGSFLTSKVPDSILELIAQMRDSGASFHIDKNGLNITCYKHKKIGF